jgi:CRP-like cAMP-binding protein
MGIVDPVEEDAVPLPDMPLFAGIPTAEIERLEHFMARFELNAGERLFGQGDESSRMYVIERGHIDVEVELADGAIKTLARLGPGESLGESSLSLAGRRTASALATQPTSGWILYRAGFDMLRLDGGAGSVELMARLTESAVARLRRRYEAVAAELPDDASSFAEGPAHEAATPAAAELATPDYVRGLLCFREFFDERQVDAVIGDCTPLELPRGALLTANGGLGGDLLLVLRGAVDVSVRRGPSAQRVRLAGPGRFVGHVGAIEGGPSPVVAHTHERLIVVEIPGERVRSMLRDPSAVARRFSSAVAQDVARAMRQAERPIARTSARAGAPGALSA